MKHWLHRKGMLELANCEAWQRCNAQSCGLLEECLDFIESGEACVYVKVSTLSLYSLLLNLLAILVVAILVVNLHVRSHGRFACTSLLRSAAFCCIKVTCFLSLLELLAVQFTSSLQSLSYGTSKVIASTASTTRSPLDAVATSHLGWGVLATSRP